MAENRIAFIGAGNMANSLIHGLLAEGTPPGRIWACDIDQDKLQLLRETTGVETGSVADVVPYMDVLVLAVKPQVMREVCLSMKAIVRGSGSPLFVSIAAGIPLPKLENWLGDDKAIVRCMPNTPSLVSQGATALFANSQVVEAQRNLAAEILSAVGVIVWLAKESDMDAVTALSGSGPAYYFLMMEAMESAAVQMGLDGETARKLTLQTALGAAKLASESEVGPEELRKRVTSPGGTTERAIRQFEDERFPEIVERAIRAAQHRSMELANELDKNR